MNILTYKIVKTSNVPDMRKANVMNAKHIDYTHLL